MRYTDVFPVFMLQCIQFCRSPDISHENPAAAASCVLQTLEAVSYIDLTPINHGSDQEDGDPAAAVPATPSSLLAKRWLL